MKEQTKKFYVHLSGLISRARLQNGFATLKELYRERKPAIDYQTWLHAESGRRVPIAKAVILIGDILDIDRESLVLAYCKDKFADVKSHQVLDALQTKGFFDVAILMQAKEHDRSDDYVFTAEQIKAMQEDIRIRLYLIYTYDADRKTSISRLASFFSVEKHEVKKVIDKLERLGLVETVGEQVKKIHFHTTIPLTADISDLRKQFLLKSLDISLNAESYISNYHVTLAEKSYKKLLGMFDFIEANLTKFEKEDLNDTSSIRYQIAIAGTKLRGVSSEPENSQSIS